MKTITTSYFSKDDVYSFLKNHNYNVLATLWKKDFRSKRVEYELTSKWIKDHITNDTSYGLFKSIEDELDQFLDPRK